ncbi:MAG TPA: cyanophycinase [Blastocatellia bacterium]|nr:cyanophycinase [Blastocatellia bacterium]
MIKEFTDPEYIGGHLVIIGGAEDKYNERRLLRKFVELAGEQEARILIVPVASDYPEFSADVYTQTFRKLGLQHINVLRATSRQEVIDADAEQLLKDVTGVFISGGDQMRLASLLGGTEFARLLEDRVRHTPLVLAGSSAGAAGMSAVMIGRGEATSHPQKNTLRLSPGLGILQNIIIDQHFTERGRLSRLITAVSHNPRQLGIGIDENTAVIISHNGTLEVHGDGTVTIIDGSRISYNDIAEAQETQPFAVTGVQLHILRDGMRYDFTRRAPIPVAGEFLLPDIE